MALILKDRVLETSQTSGTGTLTLAGAVIDFQSFSSAIGNGNTTYYTISDDADNQWEVGIGTVGASTLTRDTVLSSSNSGSKVNFGASIKNVFCDYPASKSVYQDANGLVTVPNLATNSASSLTPVLTYNASNSAQTNGATVAGSYLQNVMQNKSGTAGASTNFAVSNDLGTDSTYYGEFGMNSSVFSSGTPVDYFSLNNGIYYSGHDGDISYGSGNGYKTFLAWGTTGDKAHVINASGAIGLNTNITGTTNFGTAGQVLTSGGSAATPTWTSLSGTAVTSISFGTTGLTPATATTGVVTVAGTLAVANGGTNSTATATAGGAGYGTGTAHAYTAAGTSGQVLQSNGASAPTWTTSAGVTQSDVGSAPNQIPLNQYLGNMAYEDKDGVNIGGGIVSAKLVPAQPTPTALTATATLTTAQIQTQIIQVTSATGVTLTMPTGTVIDGAIIPVIALNTAIDFWIINTGSAVGTVTVAVATGVTNIGGLSVAISTSAYFRLVRTATNTYILYRLA